MALMPRWRFHPDGSPNFPLMLDDVLHVFLAIVTVFMLVVLFLLSKNRYRAALSTHASRLLAARQHMQHMQKKFLGSMQAEEQVMRVLEEEGWRHVFLRRRVPIARLGYNREIDVVGVGKVILVVEVKNWRGYVWSNGRNWFQAPNYAAFVEKQKKKEAHKGKSNNGGGGRQGERVAAPATLEFEDVQADNILKAAALRRYIENTKRIALPDFSHRHSPSQDPAGGSAAHQDGDESQYTHCGLCVVPVVIFTHPTVKLDPATLKKERYVFTMDTFRVFAREALRGNVSAETPNAVVERNNRALSFLGYHARRLLRPLPVLRDVFAVKREDWLLDEELQDDVAYAVDVLRTWDLVFLHDGQMITGDVVRVEAPSANCMYERKHLLDINVRWNDSAVVGMVKTLLYNEAGHVELILTTAKRLAVKKNENKPRDAHGNIRFKLQAKKHANPSLNDRLLIKPAGSADGWKPFALLDIKEVRLSHHLYESEKFL